MSDLLATQAAIDWSVFALDWSMRSVYVACFVIGGSVLLIQTLLLFLGFDGGDADFDFEADADIGDGSFGVLSVRALISFVTFFGLAGWSAIAAGWGRLASVGVAAAAGFSTMIFVAWVMRLQMKLQSQGNIDPKNAIGKAATVYLRIPAGRKGQGKITVSIQGRSAEFTAVTSGEEIPTGASVRVVSMPTVGTFDVVPLTEE
ncbi:MAG: hypothetical protein AAF682_20515 [Planctomycetota bacterium]